jgi:hypothetical protein
MSRPRKVCLHVLLWCTAILMAACVESTSSPATFSRFGTPDLKRRVVTEADLAAPSLFFRGTAKVISIDQALGYARLEYDGRQVDAYWQKEISTAQGGIVTQADPVRPGVGVYREPEVRVQPLSAKPGDTIAFIGMRTGNSIFLQGVAVISR